MAQYEQKTDSREFDVANPERNAGSWGGNPGTDATDIAIRIWIQDRGLRPTWKTDSVLVYMIADLVGASRGRVGEESSPVMVAHFDGSRQALVAARRIQTSIMEFVACRPGERIGAAILIYAPRASSSAGFSAEVALQALEQARPGQILLAEYSSQQLRDLPGIEIRAVPALTIVPGEWQSGLAELIWTTPEQIARLQDRVGPEVETPSGDNRPVDATVMVASPVRNAPQRLASETAPPAISDSFKQSPSSSLTAELDEPLDESKERPFFTRARVVLGAAAAVLIVVLILVFQRPARVSQPPLQPEQARAAQNQVKPPATPEPEATTAQPAPATAKPPAKTTVVAVQPRTPSKPPLDNRAKNKKENKESPEEPQAYDDSGGVSQKDIPALLGMAQRDAGAGNYDKAKREYKKILSLQPANQDAKDGLHRLDLIQQDQQ
jgi:hypothetical protein